MKKVRKLISAIMVLALITGVAAVNATETKTTYQQIVQQLVNRYGVSQNANMVQSKGVGSAYCIDLTGDGVDELIVVYKTEENSDHDATGAIECIIYTYVNDTAVEVGKITELSDRFAVSAYRENGNVALAYGVTYDMGDALLWQNGTFTEKGYADLSEAEAEQVATTDPLWAAGKLAERLVLAHCGINIDTAEKFFTICASDLGINIYNCYGPIVVIANGEKLSTEQCLNLLEVGQKEISVNIDGEKIVFDQPPIIQSGRTLVPVRAIFEKLGAEVLWDDATKTVTAEKEGLAISLQIGSNQMTVGNELKELDVSAQLANGRTLVPVRAISEAFGCKVTWDDINLTVYISSK